MGVITTYIPHTNMMQTSSIYAFLIQLVCARPGLDYSLVKQFEPHAYNLAQNKVDEIGFSGFDVEENSQHIKTAIINAEGYHQVAENAQKVADITVLDVKNTMDSYINKVKTNEVKGLLTSLQKNTDQIDAEVLDESMLKGIIQRFDDKMGLSDRMKRHMATEGTIFGLNKGLSFLSDVLEQAN